MPGQRERRQGGERRLGSEEHAHGERGSSPYPSRRYLRRRHPSPLDLGLGPWEVAGGDGRDYRWPGRETAGERKGRWREGREGGLPGPPAPPSARPAPGRASRPLPSVREHDGSETRVRERFAASNSARFRGWKLGNWRPERTGAGGCARNWVLFPDLNSKARPNNGIGSNNSRIPIPGSNSYILLIFEIQKKYIYKNISKKSEKRTTNIYNF